MRRKSWPVTPEDARPAGRPDECFYCQTPMGLEHKLNCVCRRKTVVIRASFKMVVSCPEEWDRHQIEFHLNESSSCADNVLDRLQSFRERLDAEEWCLCSLFKGKFLREATEDDEEWGLNRIGEDDPDDPPSEECLRLAAEEEREEIAREITEGLSLDQLKAIQRGGGVARMLETIARLN